MRAVLPLSLILLALVPSPSRADRELFARLCGLAQCSGRFARLEVFQDSKGQPARIRFRGDFRRCSHPPTIYFDMAGKELTSIDDWLRIGKSEVANADGIHRDMTRGLKLEMEIGCSSVCRVKDPASMDELDCSKP